MRKPEDCQNIEEVRFEIDIIDEEIISLISKRFGFVKEVVKYKTPTKDSIIAQERYDAVLVKRREMAIEKGLNPDVIEQMYKLMMNYFIGEELKIISK